MEIIKKDFNILETFIREPWKGLTFKQVKELSKNKSDNYVHTTLKKLVKASILNEEKVGNVILYSIDLNVNSLNTLGFVAEFKANNLNTLPNIQKIIDKIKTPYYSLIVTGSYAKNRHTKKSDLDIVIICDDNNDPKTILSAVKLESELSIPEIHPYVFTVSDLYEMLTNDEPNYGKEIAKNNLIITGAKQYYDILMRAIKNGFNG